MKQQPVVPIAIDWNYCEKHDAWQLLVASLLVGWQDSFTAVVFTKNDFGSYKFQPAVEDAFIKKLKEILPDTSQTIAILADRSFARPGKLKSSAPRNFTT